jgi:signal transduction histidine kinase/DNA-binding response OmpR family regulator/CHASE3 domain sensor protein
LTILRRLSNSTKIKVFLAFGLLTVGLVVALYFAITSFRQISDSAETLAEPNPRPAHLSHLLASLAEAESHLRAFSLSHNEQYLISYEKNTTEILHQFDTLKQLTEGERGIKQLDTLYTLITNKVAGLNTFMELKAQLDQQTFSDKALKRLDQTASSPIRVNKTLQKTETEVRRDLPPAPQVRMEPVERKGFLNKLFTKDKKSLIVTTADSSLVSTTREVFVDTVLLAKPVADSLVSDMRKILRELQQEESSNRRQLSRQELTLLANDQEIMNQIRRMILLMEQEELAVSTSRILKARRMVNNASLIIFLISCTGLLTSFIFVVLVIRDISRSNFYKIQLEKARHKAEQLRHVKEQFLANMSHEIRTPLNAIVGFSEQLHQQALLPQQREQVDAIRFSSDFLLSTVNDILDMSKIEAGQIRFEKVDFDLLDLLQHTASLLEGRAQAKDLQFSTDLPIAPAYLKGDPFRLQQILYNLLGNAIKFTDSGEVKLRCRVRDNGFGKYLVDLTVIDSGIGIPANKVDSIFESFTQADASITRRYGGSGLGLAITKKLVDLQGGEISVRTREGRGTVFYITIPFQKGKEVARPVTAKPAAVPQQWQHKRVLVVDDDALNVLLLQTILHKWKIPADNASNGTEALEKLNRKKYQLVLTDMNMPGMSGLQLMKFIRQLEGMNQQVPVIAVTANAMKPDLDRYIQEGMTDCLLKPFKEEGLLSLLSKLWETNTATAGDAPAAEEALSHEPQEQEANPAREEKVQSDSLSATDYTNGGYSLSIYQQYAAGDPAALRLMLETFLSNAQQNVVLLEQYLQEQNWQELKELAHKMYPSFKQLQADKAAALLRRLELERGSPQECTDWIRELQQEIEQVAAYVSDVLREAELSTP